MQFRSKTLCRPDHAPSDSKATPAPGRACPSCKQLQGPAGCRCSSGRRLQTRQRKTPAGWLCTLFGMQGLLDADAALGAAFGRAAFLVLDEADRLLEPSFEAELEATLRALPAERQTLLFSATMTKALVALQKASAGRRPAQLLSAGRCWRRRA
jgi:hypothetical protein